MPLKRSIMAECLTVIKSPFNIFFNAFSYIFNALHREELLVLLLLFSFLVKPFTVFLEVILGQAKCKKDLFADCLRSLFTGHTFSSLSTNSIKMCNRKLLGFNIHCTQYQQFWICQCLQPITSVMHSTITQYNMEREDIKQQTKLN